MKFTPKQYIEYYAYKTLNFFKGLRPQEIGLGLMVFALVSVLTFYIADRMFIEMKPDHAKLVRIDFTPERTTTNVDSEGRVSTSTSSEYWSNIVSYKDSQHTFTTYRPKYAGKEGTMIEISYGNGRFTNRLYVGER